MKNKIVTILAIDDNQDHLEVLRVLLSKTFPMATLFTAQTGEKGIELCNTLKPDVVLLDIAMPGMEGCEVCACLKADDQISHIPVVMLTTISVNAKNRIKAMKAGADAFLSRPIDESELTAQIRAMLRIKESEDQKISEKERSEILVQQRTFELKRELNKHKKTANELHQTIEKLEKSRETELNLLNDLRAEILVRKSAEEKVLSHLVDQRIISEFSRALVLIESKDEIYEYIGRRIHEVAGDALVMVVNCDKESQIIRISRTFGSGDLIGKIKNATGFDMLKLEIPLAGLSDAAKAMYYSKELISLTDNALYDLSARTVNKKVCQTIELIAGIRRVYTIGFTWENQLYGGIAILHKNDSDFTQITLVENLVNLASVALQRLYVEEQLQKERDNLVAILSSSPVGMLVIDENELVVTANQTACRLFNSELQQMQKQKCGDFVGCINSFENEKGCTFSTLCHACNILSSIRSALQNQQIIRDKESEIIIQKQDGISSLCIQYSIEPLLLNGNKHIILSVNDITLHKKAENEKMQAEKRYRSLIEHAPDGVVLIGLDGVYKFASSSALRIFGYELSDVPDADPNLLTHPDDLPRVLALLKDLIQNPAKVPTLEYRFGKKDGSWRWIQSTFSNMLSDSSVEAIVINFRDITERVEAEESVKVNETKYRELFNANKDGISIFYINPDNRPGNFVEVNQAACEMLGYTRQEFLGFTAMDLEAIDNPHILFNRQKEISEKGFASIETKIRHKNGNLIDVELMVIQIHYNNRIALMNIVRDITERKVTELALKASEHKYRKLHESMMDGFAFVDMEGFIRDCNESYSQMLGYNREELYRLTYKDLTPEKWIKKEQLIVNEQVLKSGFSEIYEKEYTKKDGSVIPVELHTFLIRNDNGENEGMWAIVRDITKRKQDEIALNESKQQLLDIIDFLPDATFVIDNNKKVIAWNKAIEEMTGIPKHDMIGHGDHDYSVPFYGKRQMQLLDLIDLPDDEITARYNSFHRKGDSIYAEIFAPGLYNGQGAYISNVGAPIYNSRGKRIGSIESIRDITFIKKAETALKESEEKYRAMVDILPDAIFIHDGENVLFANAATCKMIGIDSLNRLQGKTISDFVHPDSKNKARKRIQEVLLSGKSVDFTEMKFINTKGEVIDVESVGIPVTFMGKPAIQAIARDITARKTAEKEIQMKDELLHLTGEMAKVGGWEFDVVTRQGTWTSEVARIHDLDPNVTTSVEIGTSFYSGDSLRKINEAIDAATKIGKAYDLELEMTSAKGVNKWVRTMGIPVMDGNKVLKMHGIFQDITSRKEAEIILENERKSLRTLIETIPDLVWLKDPEGRYLLCNPTYERFYGASEAQIKGKTDFDIETLDLAETFSKQDHQVLTTDRPSLYKEWITCHANGQQRLVDTIKTPMYDSEGKLIGVLGIARDITEVHQSHESLLEREELFSTIVNQANDAIVMVDIETAEILEYNEAAFTRLGYTNEEFKKLKLFDIEEAIKPDKLLQFLQDLKKAGAKVFETKHHTKNNEIKDIRVSSRTMNIRGKDCLITIWTDITEKNRNEVLLREKDLIFQSLLENSPFYIFFKDHNSKTLHLSSNYQILLGKTENEIIGKDLNQLFSPEYGQPLIAAEQQLLKDGKHIEYEEFMNGRYYTTTKFPIMRDNASPMLAGFTIDITGRKLAEKEIIKLNSELEQRVNQRTMQLEHANKELEAFSYSVSHDLRAPLRGIDGWSLALLEDNGDQLDEQGHVYLSRVRSEAQRMGRLIDDLLKLSRVSRFEMKQDEVNLSSIAQTIVTRLTDANPQRQFEFTIIESIKVTGDHSMLEILLTNLLDNACKFTNRKPLARIEFGVTEADGHPAYYVRDNGAGFDMENAKNLFGAFQRMHKQSEFQGTGVGLATVQRIIHRHGGKIWAESKANKGATFFFTINVMG